jgi:hypothetical protein
MLNLFQHPAMSPSGVESWTLKQVQGDECVETQALDPET